MAEQELKKTIQYTPYEWMCSGLGGKWTKYPEDLLLEEAKEICRNHGIIYDSNGFWGTEDWVDAQLQEWEDRRSCTHSSRYRFPSGMLPKAVDEFAYSLFLTLTNEQRKQQQQQQQGEEGSFESIRKLPEWFRTFLSRYLDSHATTTAFKGWQEVVRTLGAAWMSPSNHDRVTRGQVMWIVFCHRGNREKILLDLKENFNVEIQ